MGIGSLDTDSAALARRLELQHRLSSFSLNDWILDHVEPRPREKWLDLGCGRGEQSLPLADRLGSDGAVTSVDLSEESLAVLTKEARARGTGDRIHVVHSDLDQLRESLPQTMFDAVVGSYSLYYTSNPQQLFETILERLTSRGRLFFCGPSHSNNLELRRISAEARGDDVPLQPTKPSIFMEETAPAICRSLFDEVQTFTFENAVSFQNAEDLTSYWRSHNLFAPKAAERFAQVAEDYFRVNEQFTNTKRGIGVLAIKG